MAASGFSLISTTPWRPGAVLTDERLLVLFACLFVLMMGYGMTLPVLPFYVERLGLQSGTPREIVAIQVTLLSSVYALPQLLFAPIWGQWSDRIGRRRLIVAGIAGAAAAQVLFGLSTSVWMFYAASALGGIASSATFPAAAAYVADLTTSGTRSRGMAWQGMATSLGVIAGLSLGGLTSRRDLHFVWRFGHLEVSSFSVPFFLAAALALLTRAAAMRWLPESLPTRGTHSPSDQGTGDRSTGHAAAGASPVGWWDLVAHLRLPLALAIAAQLGLALFEATFALYARQRLAYGPGQVGAVFFVCGVVMAVVQVLATGYLSRWVGEIRQATVGFALMGTGVALLLPAQSLAQVVGAIVALSLGMALIVPNLSALISKRGGDRRGAAHGAQRAADSLGRVGGPLLGGLLFAWQVWAPYAVAGSFLVIVALVVGWITRRDGTATA